MIEFDKEELAEEEEEEFDDFLDCYQEPEKDTIVSKSKEIIYEKDTTVSKVNNQHVNNNHNLDNNHNIFNLFP